MSKAAAIRSLLILVFITSMTFGEMDQQAGGSATDDVLARHVDGADIEYVSTTQAFSKALSQAGVSGGIIKVSGCKPDGVIHRWRPLGSSLRDVLDGIAKTDPEYRWSIEDRVINALPAAGEPSLLKTHVGEFKLENVVWPSSALSKLLAMPEVKASLSKLGLNEALKAGAFPLSNSRRVERAVRCNNVTLREALNVIARTFGNAVWFYKEDHCNGKDQYSIDFIVE